MTRVVLDPTGELVPAERSLLPRPASLEGKTVGLLDISKPRGNVFLDRLEERLHAIPGARRNGEGPRVPNTTNVSFEGLDAEALLIALDLEGVAVSTGAACAPGGIEPSHVLRAMGLAPERVQSSLRFSLGRGTTEADVDHAADVTAAVVARQRK